MFRETRFYLSQAAWMKLLRCVLVFLVVTLGWVLFKLPDFGQVRELAMVFWQNRHMHFVSGAPFLIFVYSLPVVAYHLLHRLRTEPPLLLATLWSMRAEGPLLGVMLGAIVLQAGSPTPFIYFQF
jgi:alginate O-acetyltransferase complex protein AlgI